MNIKNEENPEIFQCSNCHLFTNMIKTKFFYSRLCLHRLCEPCSKKVFTPINLTFKCNFCGKQHELKDYGDKTRDELYYEADYRARHKIMNIYYKRPEDFDNEEMYDDYLEELENLLIENRNIEELTKELEIKMSKSKLNINMVKFREEMNNLKDLISLKDPKRIYNTEAGFEEQFNTMQIDLEEKQKFVPNISIRTVNVKYPQLREDAKVTIKRDRNLQVRAGGYNYEKMHNDLSAYSKLGLI